MKQLHKQSSLSQQQEHHQMQISGYAPVYALKASAKPPSRPSFPRSAISYLLREQRLVFVVVGALIASTFFLLHPYYYTLSRIGPAPGDGRPHQLVLPRVDLEVGGGGGGRRIPVGLRKPPLRIVVTGGAGFVGSHLVDRLLERGDSVIVIDNFFTGRRDNVVHHFGNPRFELIRHDVVEPILLEVDQIYHLACPASPVHYKYNPIKTIISSQHSFGTRLELFPFE